MAVFTDAVWLMSGALTAMDVAGPAVALAEKLVVSTVVVTVALKVLLLTPVVVPRIQLPTVATPRLSVLGAGMVKLPPPAVPANVTLVFGTGFPDASFTIAAGFVVTAVLTAAL